MDIYLIKEAFRVDALNGELVEKEFEKDFEKYHDSMSLDCCKNEYISFQVIYEAGAEEIDNADIRFTALQNQEGGFIDEGEYEVFIEWFHNIRGKYIPDALIPLGLNGMGFRIPLDRDYLPEQKTGAMWVDLFIAGETKPGLYSGKITVSAGSIQKEFNISVKVRNIMLTDESRIFADLNNYADSISPAFPCLRSNPDRYEDGSFFKVEHAFHRLSHAHRCIFHNLGYDHSGRVIGGFAPELEGEGKNIRVKSWENFDRHFGPLLDGTVLTGLKRPQQPIPFMYLPFNFAWPSSYEKWGKKGYATEYRRILKEFIQHFEEKGWTDTYVELFLNHKKRYRYFPYDGDETRFLEDDVIMDVYNDMNRGIIEDSKVKFIFRMDSSWAFGVHHNSRYSDFVKMWVVNGTIFKWFPESVHVMKQKDNILWNYGSINDIGDNHLSLLIWPFKCIITGITGVTFWNSTGFGQDYLATPMEYGRQALMYPGVKFGYDGPLPTIRLKVLRNAMQTADLVMQTEGTELIPALKDAINRSFESNEDDWWNEKPGFINNPPHTWIGTQLSVAASGKAKKNISPAVTEKIKHEVMEIIEGSGIYE